MFMRKGQVALGTLITALALTLAGTSAQAESACKGLEKGPCEKNAACSWVDSFTRKDGVKVSGHCRSKPTQAGQNSSSKDSKKK